MSAPPLPSPVRYLLLIAAAIVAVEALAFLVLAVLGFADVSSDRHNVGVGTGLFLAVYGLGLMSAAWFVAHGNPSARGPIVFSQLIQLGLAWNVRSTPWLAAILAGLAAVALASMLAPPVTRALTDDLPPPTNGPVRD